jgi:predicted phage-related endonuclease
MSIHQDQRTEWLAARQEAFGASDVARLLGEGYAKTELERAQQRGRLIMEKAGLADQFEGNETTEIGALLEMPLLDIARKRYGLTIEPCGLWTTHPSIAHLGCTPDAFIVTSVGKFPVNCKVTSAAAQEDCKPKKDGSASGAAYAAGIPIYHAIQLNAEMMVTGADHAGLLVLHANAGLKLRLYVQPRHSGLSDRIRAEVERGWADVEALRAGKVRAA